MALQPYDVSPSTIQDLDEYARLCEETHGKVQRMIKEGVDDGKLYDEAFKPVDTKAGWWAIRKACAESIMKVVMPKKTRRKSEQQQAQ